ncbi:MAG: hypothetical protein KGI75_14450 [Rhizobiaceae bacterium]|nr:hypothetical protein [Rhizobiaceae bacterium]
MNGRVDYHVRFGGRRARMERFLMKELIVIIAGLLLIALLPLTLMMVLY